MFLSQRGWIKRRQARRALPLLLCGVLLAGCTQTPQEGRQDAAQDAAQEVAPDIAAGADKILHDACDLLAKSNSFSCSAEVWEDTVLPGTNHKMQTSRTVDLQMRRPDRLRADAKAGGSKSFYYNGKTLTVMDNVNHFYGVVDAPATVDEMVDFAADYYGVNFPLQDLVITDPYASATRNVRIGRDLGPDTVLGTPCHHLGFAQDLIDWQVWIEDGPKPLIRKIVITYKQEEGSPQFTAILSSWNFDAATPESAFTFTPPPGASKIDVLPRIKETDGK